MDVKVIRGRMGWTQQQMAAYLGLDRSSVSRMESGQLPRGPVKKLLQELMAAKAARAQPKRRRVPA